MFPMRRRFKNEVKEHNLGAAQNSKEMLLWNAIPKQGTGLILIQITKSFLQKEMKYACRFSKNAVELGLHPHVLYSVLQLAFWYKTLSVEKRKAYHTWNDAE